MMLHYGPFTQNAYPGSSNPHLTLREILRIRELAELIVDWSNNGAWIASKTPRATFEYLAVSLWTKLGICIHDVSVLSKREYDECHPGRRPGNVTTMISNVMVKLSGRCINLCFNQQSCTECYLNIVPVCTSGVAFNHREPAKKDKRLSQLKASMWTWIDEAERGDCHGVCNGCHGSITAYQHGIIDKPEGYTGN